ncbi:MAG: hypothetical protein ABR986_01875 [Methanomassiliicoccales archaeon]|jgi:hypothetical protein
MTEKENQLECAECGDSGIGLDTAGKLWVKDRFVDAKGIDEMMEEVLRMHLKDRNRITEELMSRFLLNNEMNVALEREYKMALIDEYERRQLPYL